MKPSLYMIRKAQEEEAQRAHDAQPCRLPAIDCLHCQAKAWPDGSGKLAVLDQKRTRGVL